METKLQRVQQLIKASEYRKALAIVAKFPRIDKQYKDAIISAHECYSYPDFYKQLSKDPEQLIRNGIDAMVALYGVE